MLLRFEIHSALELSRKALLCCRLAASRLHEAARWQSSLTLRIFASSKVKFSSFSIDTTTYQMNYVTPSIVDLFALISNRLRDCLHDTEMRLVPELSSHSIHIDRHIDRLSLRRSRSRTFAKTSNEKGVYCVMPFTVLKRFKPYFFLKQEIIMRLFLLEITAFSAMLGYFQILARILDFKHSSNKLADKKREKC